MNLTKSLCCRRLCFTNVATCPHCGKPFQSGTLKAKASAEDSAFDKKSHALFLAALIVVPALLLVVNFQGYLHGTP